MFFPKQEQQNKATLIQLKVMTGGAFTGAAGATTEVFKRSVSAPGGLEFFPS